MAILGFLVWRVSVAHAQVTAASDDQNAASAPTNLTIASFDPENAVAPISIVEGPGIKIGEGTVVHPVFGIETGFVSNVFYESNDPSAAGILRIIAQIGTASLNAARLNPNSGGTDLDDTEHTDKGDFEYQASVRLAYDQPLSSNSTVTDSGGLGVGALLRGMVNPMGTFSFGFDENFLRAIRAANFETSQNDNRDVNNLRLLLLLHPPGRSLSGYVYYQNTIDVIENDDQYPDRIDHRIGLHPMWRWLPQTVVYGDASLGFVSGLGDMTRKIGSMPLIAKLGISTLLSLKTSVSVAAGYTNGFYDSGPSFSAPVIDATVGYRYSPLGRIAVAYNLAYEDSINANYYRDHVIRAQIQQGFAPFVLMAQPELHFREYSGVTLTGAPPTRDDVIFALVAGVHYNFRNWIAATLDYRFSTVQTDFRYMDNAGNTIDPSFIRHELLLGMRLAL